MLSKVVRIFIIAAGLVSAQTFNARITGTINDAAGGLVPSATVTAKQVDTNVEKKTTTGESGSYDIPLLLPGTYEVRVEAPDVRYVLDIANEHFPDVSLTTEDVISSWAGLRPLIADPDGKPSEISRSHQIDNPEPGWWDVAGGKLTTYRLMAEQTVDHIVKWLNG